MRGHRETIRQIQEVVDINTFSEHSVLTNDLAMEGVVAKLVPKLMTAE